MLGHLPVIRCLPTVASAGKERSVINYIIILLYLYSLSEGWGHSLYSWTLLQRERHKIVP